MALTPRMELRQGQSLVMTPQLQQAIKLLQLSNIELQSYVAEQLEQNPLLEADDKAPGEAPAPERAEAEAPVNGKDHEVVGIDHGLTEDGTVRAADLDTDYENIYSDDSGSDSAASSPEFSNAAVDWTQSRKVSSRFDDEDGNLEATLAPDKSLRDHLSEQLMLALRNPTDRLIGAYLIDSVNEAGYLATPLEPVAEKIGTDIEDVEAVLSVLQTFDPPGVMARDLKECLAIQLRELDRLDPAMRALLDNLELIAKQDFATLMRICGVDREDLSDMLAELRRLNPKPGMVFGSEVLQPVIPDIFVRAKADGGWHVELNSDTLPRILVNHRYYSTVSAQSGRKTDKAYLTDCLNQANWLVKSLDQRARTILKVATEIVRQQDAFFVHGVRHLRPLNLKTIADAIQMHESTVSRVTANKYMATPRGVFDLKYFFTSAIAATEGGEAHSAESVRARIRELIEAESHTNVLSDDQLVVILKREGIDIARRTVAKYRESLRIPSSVQRRRLKKISA